MARTGGASVEGLSLLAAVAVLQGIYLAGAALYPNDSIGFHQLRYLDVALRVAALGAIWVVAFLSARFSPRADAVRKPRAAHEDAPSRRHAIGTAIALLIACGFTWLFLAGSNRFVNRDGVALFAKIPEAVARHGVHVTHDEMLELYLHSALYAALGPALGWSVGECYRVASAVAGGLYVLLLVLASRSMAPKAPFIFVALAMAGGYVQIFFGDVENYTLVTVAVLLFLVAARRHAEGRAPLAWPAAALGLALSFHLVAVWLLPALAYWFVRAWRQGRRRETAVGAAAVALPLFATILFMSTQGLPIERLWTGSHAAGAARHLGRYVSPLDAGYAWGMVNVLFLLVPSVVLLPVLAAYRRLTEDPYSRFLCIAAGTMIVFTFVWRAQLGIFEDWNLYVPGMVPVALLAAQGVARMEPASRRSSVSAAMALTGGLHAALWILSNRFMWR